MSTTSDKLKIVLPSGSDNNTRANMLDILESIDNHVHDCSKVYTAGGTGTAIEITTNNGAFELTNGSSFTFVASASNSGASTTVNPDSKGAIPLYKAGTNTAPNLTTNKAYTVWYSSVNSCFFLLASAGGTAVAENVLAGKTFSNDNDTGLTGTMTNNGAVSTSLSINGTYTIPAGYHNGSGTVTQSLTTKSAATYSPSTSAQTVAAGQYLSGAQTIAATTGTANTGQVLSGYTFNSANGIGLTGTITSKSAATYTPGTSNQTIAAGQYLSGAQTIAATTGTATTSKVLSGYTFNSASGVGLTGTITSKSAATYTPGTSDQAISAGQYLSGAQTIAGDTDLVAANIKYGVSIFGVTGTHSKVENITAGDNQIFLDDSEHDEEPGTTPVPLVSFNMHASGSIRLSYKMKSYGDAYDCYSQVYKNGSAVGTSHHKSSSSYTTYTEDFTVAENDVLAIYVWGDGTDNVIITDIKLSIGETLIFTYTENL